MINVTNQSMVKSLHGISATVSEFNFLCSVGTFTEIFQHPFGGPELKFYILMHRPAFFNFFLFLHQFCAE